MTKEFENFKNILGQKQNELVIQARNTQIKLENENRKKQEEDRQRQIESDQRAAENLKVLKSSGVIELFEKIRDNGIVKYSNMPLFEGLSRHQEENYLNGPDKNYYSEKYIIKKLKHKKIGDYHPAKIIFGHENSFIILAFNGYYGYTGETDADSHDICDEQYQSCKIIVLDNKKIGYETFAHTEMEITNLPEYVASEIAKKTASK